MVPGSNPQPYIICPTCYVEGRSCLCQVMTPRIVRPWSDLLKLRNRAAVRLGEPLFTML